MIQGRLPFAANVPSSSGGGGVVKGAAAASHVNKRRADDDDEDELIPVCETMGEFFAKKDDDGPFVAAVASPLSAGGGGSLVMNRQLPVVVAVVCDKKKSSVKRRRKGVHPFFCDGSQVTAKAVTVTAGSSKESKKKKRNAVDDVIDDEGSDAGVLGGKKRRSGSGDDKGKEVEAAAQATVVNDGKSKSAAIDVDDADAALLNTTDMFLSKEQRDRKKLIQSQQALRAARKRTRANDMAVFGTNKSNPFFAARTNSGGSKAKRAGSGAASDSRAWSIPPFPAVGHVAAPDADFALKMVAAAGANEGTSLSVKTPPAWWRSRAAEMSVSPSDDSLHQRQPLQWCSDASRVRTDAPPGNTRGLVDLSMSVEDQCRQLVMEAARKHGVAEDRAGALLRAALAARDRASTATSASTTTTAVVCEGSTPPRESLPWVQKYKPASATEVCGNRATVTAVEHWLAEWKQAHLGFRSRGGTDQKRDVWSAHWDGGDDSDDGGDVLGNALNNMMTLHGPVGCGKSALVFALAQQLGFEVIEVSPAQSRSRASIRKSIGEATQSRQVILTSDDAVAGGGKEAAEEKAEEEKKKQKQNKKQKKKGKPAKAKKNASSSASSSSETAGTRSKPTLVLFEEVDNIFESDRGFWMALKELRKLAKCPILLTANVLPGEHGDLNALECDMELPSTADLCVVLQAVCAAEHFPVSPQAVARLVGETHGDIRKCLMQLQLWSFRRRLDNGGEWPGSFADMVIDNSDVRYDVGCERAIAHFDTAIPEIVVASERCNDALLPAANALLWNAPLVVQWPVVQSFTPESSDVAGGCELIVRGQNFAQPVLPPSAMSNAASIEVFIGNVRCAETRLISDSEIRLLVPPNTEPGHFNLVIVAQGWMRSDTAADNRFSCLFEYTSSVFKSKNKSVVKRKRGRPKKNNAATGETSSSDSDFENMDRNQPTQFTCKHCNIASYGRAFCAEEGPQHDEGCPRRISEQSDAAAEDELGGPAPAPAEGDKKPDGGPELPSAPPSLPEQHEVAAAYSVPKLDDAQRRGHERALAALAAVQLAADTFSFSDIVSVVDGAEPGDVRLTLPGQASMRQREWRVTRNERCFDRDQWPSCSSIGLNDGCLVRVLRECATSLTRGTLLPARRADDNSPADIGGSSAAAALLRLEGASMSRRLTYEREEHSVRQGALLRQFLANGKRVGPSLSAPHLVLDYVPMLQQICRTEHTKQAMNSNRRRRAIHYLEQALHMSLSDIDTLREFALTDDGGNDDCDGGDDDCDDDDEEEFDA